MTRGICRIGGIGRHARFRFSCVSVWVRVPYSAPRRPCLVGCLFRQLHSISSLRWFWLTFHQYINKSLLYGDMLELVDRPAWGAGARKSVWVRVPLSLPESCERIRLKTLSHSKSRRMHMAPIGANMAHWESWLIRLPVTQKITGSSPVWVAIATIGVVNVWLLFR